MGVRTSIRQTWQRIAGIDAARGAGARKTAMLPAILTPYKDGEIKLSKVAAQRTRDEEQRLAVLDRVTKLPVRAREKRRPPGVEVIRLGATREQHRAPSIATELALELAGADGCDLAKRAQAEQVQSFELFGVER